MKILHIITNLENGGAEATLFRLIQNSTDIDHFVIVLGSGGYYTNYFNEIGIIYYTLNFNKPKNVFTAIFQLINLIKTINPDCIQTWMYHADLIGGMIAKLLGVKNIYWGIHGPYNRDITKWTTRIVVKCCAVLSKFIPSKIVIVSKFATNIHITIGYCKHKIINISNGYSLDMFKPDTGAKTEIQKKYSIAKDKIIIAMVARYDPYKDHENFIKSISILSKDLRTPEFICLLVG